MKRVAVTGQGTDEAGSLRETFTLSSHGGGGGGGADAFPPPWL